MVPPIQQSKFMKQMKDYDLNHINDTYAVIDLNTGKELSEYMQEKELKLHLGKYYKYIYLYMTNKLLFK